MVQVGIVAPSDAGEVRAAEDMGADSLWVGGHISSVNPGAEPVVWLSRLVEQTRAVQVGTAVLLLPLYPPALVAKQFADLDRASGGRLTLGVGVGGEYPQEFSALHVPLGERGRRTDEAIPLVRRLWTTESVTHPGPFFPMENVRIHPGPRRKGGPPIVVAGRQPVAMRRAAILGDGWMPYMYSPRRYRESVRRVREFAATVGRDLAGFSWMAYVPVCVDDDPARARREVAAFLGGTYRQDFEQLVAHVAAAGTVHDVVARLAEYVDAGARQLVLLPCKRTERHMAELLTEVAPLVRAHSVSASRAP
ncbi:LLM class flavin-dependent oxidoreductase [Streptomyces sp. NPDC002577]